MPNLCEYVLPNLRALVHLPSSHICATSLPFQSIPIECTTYARAWQLSCQSTRGHNSHPKVARSPSHLVPRGHPAGGGGKVTQRPLAASNHHCVSLAPAPGPYCPPSRPVLPADGGGGGLWRPATIRRTGPTVCPGSTQALLHSLQTSKCPMCRI